MNVALEGGFGSTGDDGGLGSAPRFTPLSLFAGGSGAGAESEARGGLFSFVPESGGSSNSASERVNSKEFLEPVRGASGRGGSGAAVPISGSDVLGGAGGARSLNESAPSGSAKSNADW